MVVTFHDINRYTALERAALARTVKAVNEPVHLPGVWNWLWDADSH
ncbi:hypothetical protein RS3R2_23360 [Pseudomonas lactis]|uniref:Polysaccharide deacetylase n=1 Tax=Pseudomonas lactis TaxID=1615674 RepID=I4KGZ1_9PSED|nr:polysaccharide deacetylase [Pseudomonas lactis]GLH48651.1 hypothetical protein RS3R2_23360 [Pseudomonas lactis]